MASVLETFLILFESNADDVDKGSQQAKRSTDQLDTSIKSTTASTDALGQGFVGMLSGAAGALTSVLSVGAVLAGVMAQATKTDNLKDFTDRLELNIEEVTAWGDAVALSGGTAEGFQMSLDSLIDGMVTFATKGTSRVAPFFKELGIAMVDANGKARNVMEVLPELADAFEGLTKQESAGLGRKLGLDQGTIMLLQQGRREVDAQIARQKELGTITKEDAEIAAKFNDTYDETAKVFRSLFTVIGSTILPVFTAILTGVQSVAGFMAKHSDFMIGLLIALGSAVLIYALPPFISMAVAVVTAFAPFLLMGALIAGVALAFALLYDDIMNFIDGNDSMIGQILTEFPIIGDIINTLIDNFKMLWSAVSWVFESILSVIQIGVAGWRLLFGIIGDGIRDFVTGSTLMQSIIEAITSAFSTMGENIGAVWDFLTARVQNFVTLIRAVVGLVSGVAGAVSGALDRAKANLGIGGLPEGKNALQTAATSPIGAQTSNSISNSARTSTKSTSVQTGPITVNTQATDAEGVAGAIGQSLGQQMRQASSTFDDGVAA